MDATDSELAVVDRAAESAAQKKARFERDALQFTNQLTPQPCATPKIHTTPRI